MLPLARISSKDNKNKTKQLRIVPLFSTFLPPSTQTHFSLCRQLLQNEEMDNLIHYDSVPIPDEYRIHNPVQIRVFRELDELGDFDLSAVEKRWTEDYDYLLSRGYQLRPRFHPGWTPTWRGTNLSPVACEDSIVHYSESVIDAKRLQDGKIVAIKRIPPYTSETKIACMLSAPERLDDPMNHCVPVYDHFPDTRNPDGGSFIAMPLLRAFNEPPFAYVDEVVDFGLVYIHSQNVAHRDLSDGNIMMDGRVMYGKKGFHPSDQDMTAADVMILAKPKTRRDVGFVKYYFTDFGISSLFDDPSRPRVVVGNRAQDLEVPELSTVIPYDPFAVDVFTLGNVFKRHFLDVCTQLFSARADYKTDLV
ncbi:hypothetical protein A7U60_g4970 [Sanghuangporus baumii]|uniref:Protein kinase domain-containing protein n=1 Tax=Sanghuangporus baumii TaxID=108892 RepID=A0A9Q5HXI3_SANBA|nr:hypothetical protein A7U60_g4970 [Sanghuangporus baumii]